MNSLEKIKELLTRKKQPVRIEKVHLHQTMTVPELDDKKRMVGEVMVLMTELTVEAGVGDEANYTWASLLCPLPKCGAVIEGMSFTNAGMAFDEVAHGMHKHLRYTHQGVIPNNIIDKQYMPQIQALKQHVAT